MRLRGLALAAVLVAGCGGQVDEGQTADELPADPGLAYESEPDPFGDQGGTDESEGVYTPDSCSPYSGWSNGNKTRLTQYQVAALAHKYGVACGTNLVRAVAITGAESGRYQYRFLRNTNCSLDRGLWQINSGYWPAYSSYAQSTNAHGMYVISSHGTNWHPWVTYNNGAYRSYWTNACTAVRALCGARPSGC
jgi:hypothetical protein